MQREEFFLTPSKRPFDMGPNNAITLEMINSLFSLRDMLMRVMVHNARLYLPSFVLTSMKKPKHLMRLFAAQQEERGIVFWSALCAFITRVKRHEDIRAHDILYLGADLVLSPNFHSKEDLLLSFLVTLRVFDGKNHLRRKTILSEGRIYLEKRIEEVLTRLATKDQDTVHLPLPPHSSSSSSEFSV